MKSLRYNFNFIDVIKEERLVTKMVKVNREKPHTGGHDDDPGLKKTGM